MPDGLSREQVSTINQLVRDNEIDAARKLLTTWKAPDALAKLNARHPETPKSKTTPVQPQTVVVVSPWGAQTYTPPANFTSRLLLAIVLLCFGVIPGLMVLPVFASEARRNPTAPGAQALLWLNRAAFGACLALLALFVLVLVLQYIQAQG